MIDDTENIGWLTEMFKWGTRNKLGHANNEEITEDDQHFSSQHFENYVIETSSDIKFVTVSTADGSIWLNMKGAMVGWKNSWYLTVNAH